MERKHLLSTLLLLAGMPLAAPAWSAGDPVAGASKAFTCMGCHGVPGYNNVYPTYHVPKLGSQQAPYIVSALKEYKSGARQHPTMQAQASTLSDQDMEDVAAYFSNYAVQLPAPHSPETATR